MNASCLYAVICKEGNGIPASQQEALWNFKGPEDNGDAGAMNYCTAYSNERSNTWKHTICISAEEGDVVAQLNYESALLHGTGFERNNKEAAKY